MGKLKLTEQQINGLCERLRGAREKNQITQAKIAKDLDVQQSTVQRWESGRSEPPIRYLVYATEAFQEDMFWLVTGVPAPYLPHGRVPRKPGAWATDPADYEPLNSFIDWAVKLMESDVDRIPWLKYQLQVAFPEFLAATSRVSIVCPDCGALISKPFADELQQGQTFTCPKCGAVAEINENSLKSVVSVPVSGVVND